MSLLLSLDPFISICDVINGDLLTRTSPLPPSLPPSLPTLLAGATALIDQGYPDCGLELGNILLKIGTDEDVSYDLVSLPSLPPSFPPSL